MRFSKTGAGVALAAVLVLATACGDNKGGGLGSQGAPPVATPTTTSAAPGMPGDVGPSPSASAPAPSASAAPGASATAPPTQAAAATAVFTWTGDPASFGTAVFTHIKNAVASVGYTVPTGNLGTLAKDLTLKCPNGTWKGNDPTAPIFVWCAEGNKVVVVLEAARLALSDKNFDYAVAVVFDLAQAWMYAKTGGQENVRYHGCVVGVILKAVGSTLDVGSDFVARAIALYTDPTFKAGLTDGHSGPGCN